MRRTILFLIPFLFLACHHEPDAIPGQSVRGNTTSAQPQASSAPLTSATASSSSPSSSSSSASSSTATAGGSLPVDVKNSGGTIDIDYVENSQHHRLHGVIKSHGKRKYALDNGAEVLEVKPGEGEFKVRRPDGSLLWKIKMDPNKIKVSDNEQNLNPIELRNGSKGVLDADRIPMMQRAVIYAELLDRKL
jgi:hypothetical protein